MVVRIKSEVPECNDYMAEWDFEHWGVQYWSKTPAFLQYVEKHSK